MKKEIKALILEDDRIVARDLMETVEDMNIEAKLACSYHEAMAIAEVEPMDLLLCDINLGTEKTGIDFVQDLSKKSSWAKTIFITAHTDLNTLESVSSLHPASYVVKPFNQSQLTASIALAIKDIETDMERYEKLKILSAKEITILSLIAQKKTSKEIADKLFISEKTVRNHRYNISKKLELAEDNNSLLTWAIEQKVEHYFVPD